MILKLLIKVLCGLSINLIFLSTLHLDDNVTAVFQCHIQDFFILIVIEKVAVLVNNGRKDLAVCHL